MFIKCMCIRQVTNFSMLRIVTYVSYQYRFDVEMKDYIQQLEDKLANRTQKQRDGKPVTGMYTYMEAFH